MKHHLTKLLSNVLSLAIYEIFSIVGFQIAGLTIFQSVGYGLLFALILGCLNEIRRDIWNFRKQLEENSKSSNILNESKCQDFQKIH